MAKKARDFKLIVVAFVALIALGVLAFYFAGQSSIVSASQLGFDGVQTITANLILNFSDTVFEINQATLNQELKEDGANKEAARKLTLKFTPIPSTCEVPLTERRKDYWGAPSLLYYVPMDTFDRHAPYLTTAYDDLGKVYVPSGTRVDISPEAPQNLSLANGLIGIENNGIANFGNSCPEVSTAALWVHPKTGAKYVVRLQDIEQIQMDIFPDVTYDRISKLALPVGWIVCSSSTSCSSGVDFAKTFTSYLVYNRALGAYPNINVKLNAALFDIRTINVIPPKGNLQLSSCRLAKSDLKTGETTTMSFTVQNVGDADGGIVRFEFDGRAISLNPAGVQVPLLQKGESRPFSVAVSGVTETSSVSLKAIARASAATADSSNCSVGLQVSKPVSPLPGILPPPPTIEVCGDSIDNDGDGLADEGCGTPPGGVQPPTSSVECKDWEKLQVKDSQFLFWTFKEEKCVLDPLLAGGGIAAIVLIALVAREAKKGRKKHG